jgi:outer membrane protein assembly factor BamB
LGNERGGCVTAIDQASGKTLWRASEDGASYSTAVTATVGGRRQAIFLTREGGLGVDASDGTILWRYPFRSRLHESANAATPIVIGDKLFLTAAYGVGSALLELQEKGVRELWRNASLGAHFATPVAHEGHVYGFDGRHDEETSLRCVRLSDGAVVWSRPEYGWGSMILAEGRFIILRADGRLVLAELSPAGMKELSTVRLVTPVCWAGPVLSRGYLYVLRTDHQHKSATLLCLDVRR